MLDVLSIVACSLRGQTVKEWRLLNRSQKSASLLAFLAGEVQYLKKQMQTAAGEYDMEQLAMLVTDIALEKILMMIITTEHPVTHTSRELSDIGRRGAWMDAVVGEPSRNGACLDARSVCE